MTQTAKFTQVFEVADRVFLSWWIVVAGACLGLAGGVVALHYLPRTYEASTTIFVAPQQIPQEFVRSTITDDMSIRLGSLREAMLSRPYLSMLIEQTFGKTQNAEDLERLIKSMRSKIEVRVIENASGERGRSGGVFRLTYRDREPERAANVVNTLANFYIDQNVRFRSAQADGTTRTLQSLSVDVLSQLQLQERAVANYKAQHLYESQAHFDANVQLLQGRQQDLAAIERDFGLAQDRLQTLKAQESQSALAPGTDAGTGAALDPYTVRFARLQQEYEMLRTRYQDDHPDVKAKKRELDDFVASGNAAAGGRFPGTPENGAASRGKVPLTPLQAQITGTQRELTRLQSEQQRVRDEIETYKRRIEETPRVEQKLAELSKGLDVLRERYRDYQTKLEEAKGSQKIEAIQKGERFEVIERAAPPALPIQPVPLVIYAIGLAAGLALFVGPVVIRAVVAPLVDSEAGLREIVDVPILVSIPRLETDDVVRSKRVRWWGNLGASAASVAVLIVILGVFGLGG